MNVPMRPVFLLLLLHISLNVFSQYVSPAERYASTILSSTIKEHVYKLASKEFQGRETGTEGNLLAAQYLADEFKSYRIPAIPNDVNYYQDLDFTSIKWS